MSLVELPNNRLASSSMDHTIKIWNIENNINRNNSNANNTNNSSITNNTNNSSTITNPNNNPAAALHQNNNISRIPSSSSSSASRLEATLSGHTGGIERLILLTSTGLLCSCSGMISN